MNTDRDTEFFICPVCDQDVPVGSKKCASKGKRSCPLGVAAPAARDDEPEVRGELDPWEVEGGEFEHLDLPEGYGYDDDVSAYGGFKRRELGLASDKAKIPWREIAIGAIALLLVALLAMYSLLP